jgi:hypothetical protein
MTTFTESDLVERRPLWEALSTLFLDTDISLDRAYRVRVLAASRFTTAQLESILLDEVYPVCALNLVNVAGVWAGFDLTWLESEICRSLDDERPPIEIPRNRFPMIQSSVEEIPLETREIIETTDVEILRAILERSKRRWEFVWGGVRIPAPVLDSSFYDRFIAHEITIAPGDKLKVRLKIKQRRLLDAGVYVNESYEVVEVLGHIPKPRQRSLDMGR